VRFELKDFQETAVAELLTALTDARRPAVGGRPQAVVLSSPTGSGKTVIVAATMERLLHGHEGVVANPDSVFLWLSDSPELNEQSRTKFEIACDGIAPHRLVTIENEFDEERLAPGSVYFLNTQKLGQKGLLTQGGDRRSRTIWATIANTIAAQPGSFYLVIDEAHRGMREAARSESAATRAETSRLTIVQKFVKGDASVGLPPVPLIVGVSATPERFSKVLAGVSRAQHPVTVEAEQVRLSGLIKDRILLDVAGEGAKADWALLEHAARKTVEFARDWRLYCEANRISPIVEPVLVVQVENGNERVPTRTDLSTALGVLRRVFGDLPEGALAHCFEEDGSITAGTQALRKIDASRIQDDPLVRVVFFKTALSTGWDCPRAEVMMSFRRAVDHTAIAQLVGRMVRTPLARRIESSESLNSVSLSLPHFDDAGVRAIIDRLQDPDTGTPVAIEKQAEMATYRRAKGTEDLFAALGKVRTYVVKRPNRRPETARLVKLARMVTFDGMESDAQSKARKFVIDRLLEERTRLRKDSNWAAQVDGRARVRVREFVVQYGRWKDVPEVSESLIDASPESIMALFRQAGSVLGEGLHDTYANRPEWVGDINTARLELYCIVQDAAALNSVQDACKGEFHRLWDDHVGEIEELTGARADRYRDVKRRGERPEPEALSLGHDIQVRCEEPIWEDHLFVDAKGKFGWKPETWERMALESARRQPGYAGFLRNQDRKDWALCVPYGVGEPKPLYPDLLVMRRAKGRVLIDILDPHGDHLADALEKAQGLAEYARVHGDDFGRVEIVRVVRERGVERIEKLDLKDHRIQTGVLRARDVNQLKALYSEHGRSA